MPQLDTEQQTPSRTKQIAKSVGGKALRSAGKKALKKVGKEVGKYLTKVAAGTATAGIGTLAAELADALSDPIAYIKKYLYITAGILIVFLMLIIIIIVTLTGGETEVPGSLGGNDTACSPNLPGITLTHDIAAQQLASEGISIRSTGNCSDKNIKSCTSLDGIQQSTINLTVNFKQSCGCQVTITGGTETGHAPGPYSHGSGYKIDIASNGSDDVSRFIKDNFTYTGDRPGNHGGPMYRDAVGNEYIFETDYAHWDILFYGGNAPPTEKQCSTEI